MDTDTTSKPLSQIKRPFFIWLILISYIISAAFTLLSYILNTFHLVPLLEGLETVYNPTTMDYVFEIIFTVLNLTGAIWLFQLKRKSYYLFLIILGLNLITSAYHLLFKDNLFGIASVSLVIEMFGWLTTIIIIIYIRKYIKEKLLS